MGYFFNFDKLEYLKGKKPEGCILCLIARGDPAATDLSVHETSSFLVSLNLYPYNPGHLLVFPKRHVTDIRQLDPGERSELDGLTDLSVSVLESLNAPKGFNIGFNMGLTAGASIDHLHLHIIPRYDREIGIAELIAGQRVLVENPLDTRARFKVAFAGFKKA